MKVWLLDSDPEYNTASFVDWNDREKLEDLVEAGKLLSSDWTPLRVELEDQGRPSDILLNVSGTLIVSHRAKEVFSQIPDLPVQFLPLDSDDDCFVMNVLTVLQCIDPEQSKKERYTGSWYDIHALSLYEDVVEGHDIFRMQVREGERILGYCYVSDRLQKLIEEQLVGWQLVDIWDSECSWQQREEQHAQMCKDVDESLVETFGFGHAVEYVEKHNGELAFSGKWALKVDENNEILVGHLQLDGTYEWSYPIYYPPIILGLTWGVKTKTNSIGNSISDNPIKDDSIKLQKLTYGGLSGLGGWLIVVQIGLYLTLLSSLNTFFNFTLPIFQPDIWNRLTTEGSDFYDPLWSTAIIYEGVTQVFLIVASILLGVIMYRKKSIFPKLIIAYYIIGLILVIVDNIIVSQITLLAEVNYGGSMSDVVRSVLNCVIWIPYFLKSVRVKNTFVE